MFWSDGHVLMPVLKERFRVVIHAMIETDSVSTVILDLLIYLVSRPLVCEPSQM